MAATVASAIPRARAVKQSSAIAPEVAYARIQVLLAKAHRVARTF